MWIDRVAMRDVHTRARIIYISVCKKQEIKRVKPTPKAPQGIWKTPIVKFSKTCPPAGADLKRNTFGPNERQ